MHRHARNPILTCTECGARLSLLAEACSECGYPATPAAEQASNAVHAQCDVAPPLYRAIRICGTCVAGAGIGAAFLDAPQAAGYSAAAGAAIYLTGLLGGWWNTSR